MNILLAEPVPLTNDNENQEQTIVEDNVYDFYVEFVDDFQVLNTYRWKRYWFDLSKVY